MNITSWRNMNDATQLSINKESFWLTLTLLHQEARSRSDGIPVFCIEKCKQPEMNLICALVNACKFDSIRHFHMNGVYSITSNIIDNFYFLFGHFL